MILNPSLNPLDDRACRVRGKIAVTYGLLIAANAAAWVWALSAFTDRPALLGTALLAYMFGLQHAFDADHIAAIDNVVRKLMQEGKAPYSVGFFFALGHSTIVIFASLVVASTAAALRSEFDLFGHTGGNTGSLLGTVVSSLFLLVIGIANLFILKEI